MMLNKIHPAHSAGDSELQTKQNQVLMTDVKNSPNTLVFELKLHHLLCEVGQAS